MLAAIVVIFILVYTETGPSCASRSTATSPATPVSWRRRSRARRHGRDAVLQAARTYLRAQPYGANAALLFVVVPGAGAAFNHPEIAAPSQPDGGESAENEHAERGLAVRLLVPRLGWSEQRVPDIGQMRILERRVAASGVPVIVGAGEPLAIIERAQHGVAQTFGVAGRSRSPSPCWPRTSPARGCRRRCGGWPAVATRVDAGELEPRMDASRGGGEVAVLAEAFNNMLDRLTDELKGQREFIADASHELRTPITVIRGQIEVLAAQNRADAGRRAAHRRARPARDHPDQPARRRPAAAGPGRARRLPAARADRAAAPSSSSCGTGSA